MESEKGTKIIAVMAPEISFDSIAMLNETIEAYDPILRPQHDGIAHIDRTPNDARFSSL